MLNGVFAASITPLKSDFSPDLSALPQYLNFLASRGCHGALLLGTTGEGPSFSSHQRVEIINSALEVRQDWPDFRLLIGTGTPSLDETINLTRTVFERGLDGVVLLPPYYFQRSDDNGLYAWFAEVMEKSVPSKGSIIAYHIPGISGIELSINLLTRLRKDFPDKFVGLKDSSGEMKFSNDLARAFGDNLTVFTGNDRFFSMALNNGASGCITAAANIISPILRNLWDSYQGGESTIDLQTKVDSFREKIEMFPPFPPLIKFILAQKFNFPHWAVCPPLSPLSEDTKEQVSRIFELA